MTGPQSAENLHELASRPSSGVLDTLKTLNGSILVLGAGGKMGLHLSLMLHRAMATIESPHELVAVSRFSDQNSKESFRSSGIRTISADLSSESALGELPDADGVFFLAGVKFGTQADPASLQRINVELPTLVARRFFQSRVVALSTGCVYPFVPVASGGSLESDIPQPKGDYAVSCLGREKSFSDSGGRVSLIRLNYSVDLRYGVLVDIARKVLHRQPIDLETGYFNVIWQGDANRYIIQALTLASAPPRVLNVTGSKILSVRSVAEQFAERFKVPVEFQGRESPTAWLSNASECHRQFGEPEIDEDHLIDWVADWLQAGHPTLDKPTHFEVRDGKF